MVRASGSPRCSGVPVTAVVEALEPPDAVRVVRRPAPLVRLRDRRPRARAPAPATARALKANHVARAAVRPRPRRHRPRGRVLRRAHHAARRAGHARPAHRRADPPHRRLLRRPGPAPQRRAARRSTPPGRASSATTSQRVTQDLAHALEDLIRRAPEQWHLLQPNWPSTATRDGGLGSRGRPRLRRCASAWSAPTRLTIPGGVQGQVLGLARVAARASATRCGCSAPATARRPTPASPRSGRSVPTAANGSVAPIAPDPSAQLRTIRALRDEDFDVAPPPRADGARARA